MNSKDYVRQYLEDLEQSVQETFSTWKENNILDIALRGVYVTYQETHSLSTVREDEDYIDSFEWRLLYILKEETYEVRGKGELYGYIDIEELKYLDSKCTRENIVKRILDKHNISETFKDKP